MPFSLPSPFSITRFNFFCLQVLLTRAWLLALAKSIYIYELFEVCKSISHFSCFPSFTTTITVFLLFSSTTTFLSFSFHQYIAIGFPPLPPLQPQLYCFQSATTTIFLLVFLLHYPHNKTKNESKKRTFWPYHDDTHKHVPVCLLCRRMNCNRQENRTAST